MYDQHWTKTLHHNSSSYYVTCPNCDIGATVTIRLRVARSAPVRAVFLRTCPDGEQAITPMHDAGNDDTINWWEGAITLSMPVLNYRFLILAADGTYWLNNEGITRHAPLDDRDFRILAHYQAPRWVQSAVFYQIFPDRFADGDPFTNVRTGEYVCHGRTVVARAWEEEPWRGSADFYGGDLNGIIERLEYLKDLGVTALYLTPIFTSPSNHKYDVADYREVDKHFGGNQALIALREKLDTYNMRLLLDIVPNHCGSTHPWFLAAQANRAAPTAEFFTFHNHPNEYESWLRVRSLPKLNYESANLREEIFAGPNAIMRHWLRPPYRADGWRIDVANMLARQGKTQLGHEIARAMRQAVKEENSEAYLLGENFYDGTSQLQGDELDATMNYRGFTLPLLHWLAGFILSEPNPSPDDEKLLLPTDALLAQWHLYMSSLPWQIASQQFNMLGSHDTPRVLTILNGDFAKMRLAVALLFTYPGVPCIYYGDEVGLYGKRDPDSRRCMPWNAQRWNHELRDWYQRLIKLRRSSAALQQGGFQVAYAENDTFAFLREAPEERILVVARRRDDGLRSLPVWTTGLADGTQLREYIRGDQAVVKNGMLALDGLPATGIQIWRVDD
jgi:alpha-glucosidase